MKMEKEGLGEKRLEYLGLLAVLTVALLLRLRHLDALLPWFLFEDEKRATSVTLHLLSGPTMDTAHGFYPALGFYVNAIFYIIWAIPGLVGQIMQSGISVVPEFFRGLDPLSPVTINLTRWISLAFAMASLAAAHLLFKLYLNWRWALFATLLLTLNTMHVSMSAMAKVDSLNLFWMTAGYYSAVMYHREGSGRWLAAAALMAGFSVVTKNNYQLGVTLTPLVVYKCLEGKRSYLSIIKSPHIYLALIIMAAAAFIGSPYSFIRFKDTLVNMGWLYRQAEIHSFYHTDPHVWWRDRYYYLGSIVLPFVFGLPLFWAAIVGFINHVKKRLPTDFYLALNFAIFIYVFATHSGGPKGGAFAYYLFLNMVPIGILMAVELVSDLAISPRPAVRTLGPFIAVLLLVWSVLRVDAHWSMFYSHHDKLGEWIQKRVAPDSRVLLMSVHEPTRALGVPGLSLVWPQSFTEELIGETDPDVIIIDAWALGGFRKVYKDAATAPIYDERWIVDKETGEYWLAPLADSIMAGETGYDVVFRYKPDYFNRGYYVALDPEHDVEMVVLVKRDRKDSALVGGQK